MFLEGMKETRRAKIISKVAGGRKNMKYVRIVKNKTPFVYDFEESRIKEAVGV